MLIPLTAGGLVIGRKGANIAALLEASGAKVTLGQKADVKVHERLVTVQGKLPAATKVMTSPLLAALGLPIVIVGTVDFAQMLFSCIETLLFSCHLRMF